VENFLLRKLEIPPFWMLKVFRRIGVLKKRALYILSWVGGVWGGVKRIYRAFQFNVNAYYTKDKALVKDFF
jgi:hypothetical protein